MKNLSFVYRVVLAVALFLPAVFVAGDAAAQRNPDGFARVFAVADGSSEAMFSMAMIESGMQVYAMGPKYNIAIQHSPKAEIVAVRRGGKRGPRMEFFVDSRLHYRYYSRTDISFKYTEMNKNPDVWIKLRDKDGWFILEHTAPIVWKR